MNISTRNSNGTPRVTFNTQSLHVASVEGKESAFGVYNSTGATLKSAALKIQDVASEGFTVALDAEDQSGVNIGNAEINPANWTEYKGGYADAPENQLTLNTFAVRSVSGANVTIDGSSINIFGTIVAGRGVEDSDVAGGSITIGDGQSVVKIRGDVYAGNGGTVSLTLSEDSILEGQIDDYHELNTLDTDTVFRNSAFMTTDGSTLPVTAAGSVSLTLNGGTWVARGQSFVNKLNSENAQSVVDLSQNENSSVAINELTGSGQFKMRLNNDPAKSDMLYVQNLDKEAHYQISVVLDPQTTRSVYELKDVRIATTKGHHQTWGDNFTVVMADQGVNNVRFNVTKEAFSTEDEDNALINGEEDGSGTYKPGENVINAVFGQEDSTNWVVAMDTTPSEEPETPVDPQPDPDVPSGPQTSLADAGNALLATARGTYWTAVEIDRLTNRMGDARYASNADDGLWIRLRQSRLGTAAGEGDFKSSNTTYQVGYDHAFLHDGGRQVVGVAFDYMDTDLDYRGISGEGNTDRYGITAYNTWLGNNGFYVDVVGKWGRLDNDFDIVNNSGSRVKADYGNDMWAISAEVGRKFTNVRTGMFLEPNAQLQYTVITDAQYRTNQGTSVDQDKIDSVIGRMGLRIGRAFGENQNHTVYGKADVFREFMGEQKIHVKDITTHVNGDTISVQNKGTWFDVGGGFQSQFGENAYAYADVEYRFGNDLDQSWLVNVGLRYWF